MEMHHMQLHATAEVGRGTDYDVQARNRMFGVTGIIMKLNFVKCIRGFADSRRRVSSLALGR
jgi:hypothetical protein